MTEAGTATMEELLQERLAALTLEQKVRLLTGADFWSLYPEPAAGLRRLVLSDGPAGVRGERWDERDPSANVPSPTSLAATWDDDRVERIGALLAGEARAKGVDVLLAPTVNLHRTPYGGRHFECLSEDPYLTSRIGAAYVRGVQSGGVAATVKHFVANDSETQRFTLNAVVDERTLRELYLEPFDVIVRAGVWAVMAAYNSVNGTTMTEHPMLRLVLHDEWGFDGVVMSDWFATRTTDAAGSAGLDLAMPGPGGPWGDALVAAVRAGRVAWQAVDDKVLRILRLAGRVGALEGVAPAVEAAAPWPSAKVSAELRAAAAAGVVLVRNVLVSNVLVSNVLVSNADVEAAPVLPLDAARLTTVAVLGPNSRHARTLGGGSATVFPPYTVSPVAGLAAALGDSVRVLHAEGVRAGDRIAGDVSHLLVPGSDETGVEIRFLAPDGAELLRETRSATSFTWHNDIAPGVSVKDVAAIEVHARLRAEADATLLVGGSGVGAFRLTVGGTELFDTRLELRPGADPIEALFLPPQHVVPVAVRAGEAPGLVLRYRPKAMGGFGDADVTQATFQVTAASAPGEPEAELAAAVEMAREADVAVVVVGTTEQVESEGYDRDTLALPGRQDELVRAVAAVNPRTVVVVNSGSPVLLPWADEVAAILLAWFPGQEFGNALADVLLGAVEPGGRLPTTWPAVEDGHLPATLPVDGVVAYDEGLFIGYRAYDRDGREPRYRFGHGLGYTSWEYLSVDAPAGIAPGADATVRVRLRNTGPRTGREVVQVYLSAPAGGVERPVRWLAGYAAVSTDPGQEVTVPVTLRGRAFAHWEVAGGSWRTEAGTYQVRAGHSSGDLPAATVITVG